MLIVQVFQPSGQVVTTPPAVAAVAATHARKGNRESASFFYGSNCSVKFADKFVVENTQQKNLHLCSDPI